MPELPEVETTKNIIEPIVQNKQIQSVTIYQEKLRYIIPNELSTTLPGKTFNNVARRGKYLLLGTNVGTIILHLGMTGCLKHVPKNTPLIKHDHFEIILKSGIKIRYNDPRKFGFILWTTAPALEHHLLAKLGPEPLSKFFNNSYLIKKCSASKKPIKSFIMDNCIVTGVGNIYATEVLFISKILPTRAANSLSNIEIQILIKEIKKILKKAIKAGGTTLKDFYSPDGKPGYFKQQLLVYGKKGENCTLCSTTIESIIIAQRTTSFCPSCQQ